MRATPVLPAAIALALVTGRLPVRPEAAYRTPPSAIENVLEAPAFPRAFVSPARDVVLLATPVRMLPIAELALPMLRLAGLRIDPNANGIHHAPSYAALELVRIADGRHIDVALNPGTRAGAPVWSVDGRRFAFANATAAGTELWTGSADSGRVERVDGVRLNTLFSDAIAWLPNGAILAHVVAPDRGAPPPPPRVPAGPSIEETAGTHAAAVTYEDLLTDAHDEALFTYYAGGRYALVDAGSHAVTTLTPTGVYARGAASPDGRFVAYDRISTPYSYQLPWTAFPHRTFVIDVAGKPVRALPGVPLQERATGDDVPAGPRGVAWAPSAPATLVWVEPRVDGRDVASELDVSGATNQPRRLVTLAGRFRSFDFVAGSRHALVRDYDRDARVTRTLQIDLAADNTAPATIDSSRDGDLYHDLGRPLATSAPGGALVAAADGDAIFLAGEGASSAGRRPFVDRFDLRTHERKRLFQSALDPLETVVALLDGRGDAFLVQRQSPTQPPDFFVRRLDARDPRPLTHFVDPTPQIRSLGKRIVTYKRADGVECSFALYLPPGYREGTRLPTLLWAYPYEFNDAAVASQVTNFAQTFESVSGASPILAALAGYAVLDNVSMPVVGDAKTVNDTFLQQIEEDAKAAIDRAVEIGVTDRTRVAVGGHSYGAFMTANLLAHTRLFRAGIAESGAYNRSLTPFGFQNERRTYWQATDLYTQLSPFSFADRIEAPLLLVHGEADDNTGTFPLQSTRMYAAIRGNGGIARLVMLPYEAHAYVARESIETTVGEMLAWLDRFLRVRGSAAASNG